MFTIAGPASTWDGERKTGGTDLVGKYDGVFGSTLAASAAGCTALGEGRQLRTWATTSHFDRSDGRRRTPISGGFGFFQDQKFKRDVYKADADHVPRAAHD